MASAATRSGSDHSSKSLLSRNIRTYAGVAELADAQDLKSWVWKQACGFDRRPRHRTVGESVNDNDDMQAELERLRAENELLKTQRNKGISLKVSEKGGVSVYGLGRFPVTLYKEQW